MNAVLAIWNNVTAEHEAEFNEWYVREHVPERVGIPGFLNGRRHLALSSADPGCPRNFTFYEVTDLQVLQSTAYLERLNRPTPWTQKVMPWFENMSRTACQVRGSAGLGHGAFAGTLRFRLDEGTGDEFHRWAQSDLLPGLVDSPGVVSAQCWQGDQEATNVDSTEGGLRRGPDAAVSGALMMSATHAGALVNAASMVAREVMADHGAVAGEDGGLQLFQLVYTLEAGS